MSEILCFISPLLMLLKKLSDIKCNGVYGVCIPSSFGKTECIKQLQSDSFLLLDFETCIKLNLKDEEINHLDSLKTKLETDSYNAHYYPLAKKYLEKMKKEYKKKNILVFCSDPKLLEFCQIKKVLYLAPNTKFFNEQIKNFGNSEKIQMATSTRDNIIRCSGNKLKGFSGWEELVRLVSQKYNLKAKI